MATVQAGVVTAVQVQGPINANPPSSGLADTSSGGFWAAVWFVVALVLLFIVL